jgi:gentisate 1,2-dioxygenase
MHVPKQPLFVEEPTETQADRDADLWEPAVLTSEDLDAEVDRLSGLERPANGRRRSLIVHPRAAAPGIGLAPGIQVALDVLLPGETTSPRRHNSSSVTFSIRGRGTVTVDEHTFSIEQYDVVYIPALSTYTVRNESDALAVRLTYSNAPILEKLRVHWVDEAPDQARAEADDDGEGERRHDPHPVGDTFALRDGAYMMSYEKLINPDAVPQVPLIWRWVDVKRELDKLASFGADYRGRRLYLLYNPATGRTNGTTPSFFATMTIRPPDIVDRPHRHTSAAINYFFSGSGWSRVSGRRYEWAAGDLMLSAPGWAIHNHASNGEPVYELTIQDSPFHIAGDSLMWQENLKQAPILLGSHPGWETNRGAIAERSPS